MKATKATAACGWVSGGTPDGKGGWKNMRHCSKRAELLVLQADGQRLPYCSKHGHKLVAESRKFGGSIRVLA